MICFAAYTAAEMLFSGPDNSQNCPLPGAFWPNSMHWFLEPTSACPKRHLDRFAFYSRPTSV